MGASGGGGTGGARGNHRGFPQSRRRGRPGGPLIRTPSRCSPRATDEGAASARKGGCAGANRSPPPFLSAQFERSSPEEIVWPPVFPLPSATRRPEPTGVAPARSSPPCPCPPGGRRGQARGTPHLDAPRGKLDADGRLALEVELVSREAGEQVGLADTRVPDHDHLEQVVVAERRRRRGGRGRSRGEKGEESVGCVCQRRKQDTRGKRRESLLTHRRPAP